MPDKDDLCFCGHVFFGHNKDLKCKECECDYFTPKQEIPEDKPPTEKETPMPPADSSVEVTKEKKTKKKGAKQQRLPGIEDAKIQAMHDIAEEYVEVRDERQALTAREVPLKEKLIKLMHKNEKTTYRYGNLEIKLVSEKENVKVKLKSGD